MKVRDWEKEGRKKREKRGRKRRWEGRASRKECESVRDSYSGGGTRARCGWDLRGFNKSLRSGSGKLGDRGES